MINYYGFLHKKVIITDRGGGRRWPAGVGFDVDVNFASLFFIINYSIIDIFHVIAQLLMPFSFKFQDLLEDGNYRKAAEQK